MGFCTMVSLEFHGWPRLATFLHPSSLLQAFLKPLKRLQLLRSPDFLWVRLKPGKFSPFPTSRINKPRKRKLRNSIFNSNANELYQIHLCSVQIYNIEQYNCCTIESGRSSNDCDNFSWHLGFFPQAFGLRCHPSQQMRRLWRCPGWLPAVQRCSWLRAVARARCGPQGVAADGETPHGAVPADLQPWHQWIAGKDGRKTIFFSHEIRGFPGMFPFNYKP